MVVKLNVLCTVQAQSEQLKAYETIKLKESEAFELDSKLKEVRNITLLSVNSSNVLRFNRWTDSC